MDTRIKVNELMEILRQLPGVTGCHLYGSLKNHAADQYSDIDLEIDLADADPGQFILQLPNLLAAHTKILYADYAPSMAPDKYIVSVGLDETNPFLIADLCCSGGVRPSSVSTNQLKARNDPAIHLLKLWIANCKHHRREQDCRKDILRMAAKIGLTAPKSNEKMLEDVLCWLEEHTPPALSLLIENCRNIFQQTKGPV